jgi:hypothetical protein
MPGKGGEHGVTFICVEASRQARGALPCKLTDVASNPRSTGDPRTCKSITLITGDRESRLCWSAAHVPGEIHLVEGGAQRKAVDPSRVVSSGALAVHLLVVCPG